MKMPYSVGHGSDTTVADNAGRGDIVVQAYSPLQGGGLVHDADCTKIGAAHGNKTAVQVRRDEARKRGREGDTACLLGRVCVAVRAAVHESIVYTHITVSFLLRFSSAAGGTPVDHSEERDVHHQRLHARLFLRRPRPLRLHPHARRDGNPRCQVKGEGGRTREGGTGEEICSSALVYSLVRLVFDIYGVQVSLVSGIEALLPKTTQQYSSNSSR